MASANDDMRGLPTHFWDLHMLPAQQGRSAGPSQHLEVEQKFGCLIRSSSSTSSR
jgi:hypothetical protein